MEVMIWFLVYLLLILALARWRDHHDAARSKKRRPTNGAQAGGESSRQPIRRRSAWDPLRHSHRTS